MFLQRNFRSLAPSSFKRLQGTKGRLYFLLHSGNENPDSVNDKKGWSAHPNHGMPAAHKPQGTRPCCVPFLMNGCNTKTAEWLASCLESCVARTATAYPRLTLAYRENCITALCFIAETWSYCHPDKLGGLETVEGMWPSGWVVVSSCQPLQNSGNKQSGTGVTQGRKHNDKYFKWSKINIYLQSKQPCFLFFFFNKGYHSYLLLINIITVKSGQLQTFLEIN